jgi:hypothetical protein
MTILQDEHPSIMRIPGGYHITITGVSYRPVLIEQTAFGTSHYVDVLQTLLMLMLFQAYHTTMVEGELIDQIQGEL